MPDWASPRFSTTPNYRMFRNAMIRRPTSNDRIGWSTPTIPRSDDNKDAMIRAIALSQKARNERRFRAYFWAIDVSGKAGPSHYLGALSSGLRRNRQRCRYRAPHGSQVVRPPSGPETPPLAAGQRTAEA